MLALGFVALACGVAGGLQRIGVSIDAGRAMGWHGPLMVSGFFGTVIGLERAVALARPWPYLAPIASAAGALLLLAGSAVAGSSSMVAAAAILLAASLDVWRRQPAPFTLIIALAAGCWLAGNALWAATGAASAAIPWWLGFLVLTIAGERLELSRYQPTSAAARRVFAAIVMAMLAGFVWATLDLVAGLRLVGATFVALAAWLFRQDIARRTVRGTGLTRFVAVCLLSGYAWLAIGGLLFASGRAGGFVWDAAIHAVMLGFVFAMVFGHAPIIFPAVLRVAVPYHWTFYLPLALLHVSVAIRVVSDLAGMAGWRATGGGANALALAAFVVSTLSAVLRDRWRLRCRAGRAETSTVR